MANDDQIPPPTLAPIPAHFDANPVRRARLMVEAEVPPERRGPGWDRHWRELEAYAEDFGEWTIPPEPRRD